eukprot:2367295-Karenia_brevis.AAC.1
MVYDAWKPIFHKFASTEEPDWMKFKSRFDKYISHHAMAVSDITGEELLVVLSGMNRHGACGMDGWR